GWGEGAGRGGGGAAGRGAAPADRRAALPAHPARAWLLLVPDRSSRPGVGTMIGTAADLLTDIAGALAVVLPEQRWFAGKGHPVRAVIPVHATDLAGSDPRLVHAVVEVDQGARPRDRYQLLLGVRGDLPETLGHAWVATTGDRVVYQAVHDPELTAVLLELMAQNADRDGVRFTTEPGVTLDTSQRSRPVGAEQSNTSLVYGQTYILKLFRKVTTGANPDLELHRALTTVGCPHIAAPLGSIVWALGSAQ